MSSDTSRLLLPLFGVLLLVVLIARMRLHAFVALLIVSLLIGLASGLEPADVVRAFAEGVGGVLRSIAAVVGLGTVLGKLLAESGGAQGLATTLIRAFGEKRLSWAMLLIGFLVGLPTWFTVGLVLLVPVVLAVRRASTLSLIQLGLPLIGGLALAHGLVPPHPGPMAAIGTLSAQVGRTDTGRVILYAILIAIPCGLIGHALAVWLSRRMREEPGNAIAAGVSPTLPPRPPPFALTVVTILLPIVLMLAATVGAIMLPAGHGLRRWSDFVGDPTVAMLLGVLFALWSFGSRCGYDRQQLSRFTEECLGPVATVLLVVGAGGGFSKVLAATGVGDVVASMIRGSGLSPLILGWMLAALIRVATGSSTVGITMAAGMLAPVAAATPGTSLELLVVAMGAGSLFLSHLNDGGFWFVKEYFQLSVAQTLRTWTILVSALAILALVAVLLLDRLHALF
jgi:gluconate:H+ symporter, GntP family